MTSSMHRRAKGLGALKCAPVALCGQLLEKLHHRFFGWISKAPAGDAFGGFKQFFGIGHFSPRFVDAPSVGRAALRRTQALLTKVALP